MRYKMKVEINCDDLSGQTGYWLKDIKNNRKIRNYNNMFRQFSEDDILLLLTDKQYSQFENGKCVFDIPNYIIVAISDDSKYYRTQDLDKISKFKVQNMWSR